MTNHSVDNLSQYYENVFTEYFDRSFFFNMKNNLSNAEAFILNVISGCVYVVAVTHVVLESV